MRGEGIRTSRPLFTGPAVNSLNKAEPSKRFRLNTSAAVQGALCRGVYIFPYKTGSGMRPAGRPATKTACTMQRCVHHSRAAARLHGCGHRGDEVLGHRGDEVVAVTEMMKC